MERCLRSSQLQVFIVPTLLSHLTFYWIYILLLQNCLLRSFAFLTWLESSRELYCSSAFSSTVNTSNIKHLFNIVFLIVHSIYLVLLFSLCVLEVRATGFWSQFWWLSAISLCSALRGQIHYSICLDWLSTLNSAGLTVTHSAVHLRTCYP